MIPAQNLSEGRKRRDRGIAKSTSKNSGWLALALALLPRMKSAGVTTCTGESIRIWMLANSLPPPTSPHAWGALTRHAITNGLLEDTKTTAQMMDPSSHARRTPLWRFL